MPSELMILEQNYERILAGEDVEGFGESELHRLFALRQEKAKRLAAARAEAARLAGLRGVSRIAEGLR
jgi:hypothetical protein